MTRDIPVLMSAPMVRATLDDRKTMTRRLAWLDAKKAPVIVEGTMGIGYKIGHKGQIMLPSRWQIIKPGDRLWVREIFRLSYNYDMFDDVLGRVPRPSDVPAGSAIDYLATHDCELNGKTRSSIHMPRWASRLTLVVTATKIERLQDISEADATAEGAEIFYGPPFDPAHAPTNRRRFELLWRHLHGPEAWDANPEVVAVSFRVHKCNVDQMPGAA